MDNQHPRSYAILVVAIVIVVLVIGASVIGASYFRMVSTAAGTSTLMMTSRSTTTVVGTQNNSVAVTSQASFTELSTNSSDPLCGTVFQNGLSLTGEPPANSTYDWQERLFLMPTNATATICVSFNGLMPVNSSNSPNADSYPGDVDAPNVTYTYGGQAYGYTVNSDNPAPGIVDTATSHLLTIGNETYPVMIYTIRAAPNATGVYALTYSYQCPPWIPITIGYTTAEAQEAIGENYHIFLYSTGCIMKTDQPNGIIVGVGGNIDLGWVVSG
jgi:hypothetical protein